MLIGSTTFVYRNRSDGRKIPILDSIKLLKKAGFQAVDLNFADALAVDSELAQDNWMEWVEEVKSTLDSLGMVATQSHGTLCDFTDENLDNRPYREMMSERAIIASGMLGIPWVILHAGNLMGDPYSDRSKQANLDYFRKQLALAKKHHTGIAIENLFDTFTSDNRRTVRRYCGGVHELVDLVDTLALKSNNVGVCWDFGHANQMGLDPYQCLTYVGSRLKTIHVNDNYGVLDEHLLPFNGTVDWYGAMKALKEINYQGDFSYETHRYTQNMPDELVEDALRFSVKLAQHLIGV